MWERIGGDDEIRMSSRKEEREPAAENLRKIWFAKAEEIYPDYFRWPLWMRMEFREEINRAAGFSL